MLRKTKRQHCWKKRPMFKLFKSKINHFLELKNLEKKFKEKSTQLSDNGRFICNWEDRYLCISEDTKTTEYDAHYVYHTAWAARILKKTKPEKHVDIASDLRFVTIVSAFVPVEFIDYRPVNINLSNFESKKGNITDLPFENNSFSSISCMHVIEHIGLERYGDSFDPKGDLKGISELKRVLKDGGQLLFVVPVGGIARIEYNAHRIYTYEMVCKIFNDMYIENFALVKDNGEFIENANQKQSDSQKYGCGCWQLRKKK